MKTNKSELAKNKKARERRLYLSTIDSHYRPDHDLVLGPWCFIGMDDTVSKWEEQPFLDAFESPESISQGSSDCSDLTSYLVRQWGNTLNERHGTKYATDYWSPLLTRWIFHMVGATWRRWNLIKRFVEKHQDKAIRVSVISAPRSISWHFSGLREIVHYGFLKPEFDLWLYSLCLEKLAPSHWIIEPIKNFTVPSYYKTDLIEPQSNTNPLRRLGRKILGRLPFSDIPGIGPIGTLIFSTWVQVIPRRTPAQYFFEKIEIPPDNFPDTFLEMLDTALKNSTLDCLDTDFHKHNEAAKLYKYTPGQLFVTAASHSNESVNFQTAHAIANGESVVRVQHGSTYGTIAHGHCKKLTEYNMSAFFTWGWTEHNNNRGRFLPIPAPSLCRIRNRHQPHNEDVILVGTRLILRSQRVDYTPDPAYALLYRKEKIKFVSALDDRPLENLSYRPYMRSYAELEDGKYVLSHFPKLKILSGSLEKAMLRCRLLVLDHPGTTLNIAMASNTPTICFWDSTLWPYSKEASPYFKAMKNAGMVFDDGPSAARQINNVYDNVQNWWQSHEVQSARQAWADQYAYTSKVWWWHWFHALYKV